MQPRRQSWFLCKRGGGCRSEGKVGFCATELLELSSGLRWARQNAQVSVSSQALPLRLRSTDFASFEVTPSGKRPLSKQDSDTF